MLESRVYREASNEPALRVGFGGNLYVFCKAKSPLSIICKQISKAPSSIYWNRSHFCWVFRVKNSTHKERLRELRNELL